MSSKEDMELSARTKNMIETKLKVDGSSEPSTSYKLEPLYPSLKLLEHIPRFPRTLL